MLDCIKIIEPASVLFGASTTVYNAAALVGETKKYKVLTPEDSEKNRTNIVTKIVINILKIVSGGIQTIASGAKWIAEVSKNISCLVYLRCFSVFAIVIHGVASFIDLFRIIENLKSLSSRIDTELNRATLLYDSQKEKQVMAYKLVKYIDIMSSLYSVALCIITVFEFIGLAVFSPTAIFGIIALGGLLYLTSFIISKIYNIDEIEQKYFGRARG